MAHLVKTVCTFDDGSTQEFNAAPAVNPSQIVDLAPGQTVEVVADGATAPAPATTPAPAPAVPIEPTPEQLAARAAA